MFHHERHPQHIKRAYLSESPEEPPSKRIRHESWEPPLRAETDAARSEWLAVRHSLQDRIANGNKSFKEYRSRAEHILSMIDAIACDEVLEAWKASSDSLTKSISASETATAACAIYKLVHRGQSRSFRDNAILRIGKYLLASRLMHRINDLKSQGPPSKQKVAAAGSTGEGKAITRALEGFVSEVFGKRSRDVKARKVRRCKQWWREGKLWKLVAEAIDPAILLLIPNGQAAGDGSNIWDSE